MSEVAVDSNKEAAELLAGLVVVALSVKAVLKDGKVGLEDLPVVLDLLKKQAVLLEAAKGVGEIKIKDLELASLVISIVKAVQDVRAA